MDRSLQIHFDEMSDEYFVELPDELIEELGWNIGDTINWEIQDDYAILKKADTTEDLWAA